MYRNILKNTRDNGTLVHCITNYVTVNDCANALLAIGASPVMADDINEVEEVISLCNSLVINIGTLNKRTIESMFNASKKANELNKPIILDPVGFGATKLRNDTILWLLQYSKISVLKGNISEIKSLIMNNNTTKGVDANPLDLVTEENLENNIEILKELARELSIIIVVTGAIDIVTDGDKTFVIRNGSQEIGLITGTGCMLGCILGAFVGENQEDVVTATAVAVAYMGVCGELAAKEKLGIASLKRNLIDKLNLLTYDEFEENINMEVL